MLVAKAGKNTTAFHKWSLRADPFCFMMKTRGEIRTHRPETQNSDQYLKRKNNRKPNLGKNVWTICRHRRQRRRRRRCCQRRFFFFTQKDKKCS